jgi:glycosyltransferase involved in cell wall biosynthesis
LKVLYVSPSFYPAEHFGGTTFSGFGLCNALAKVEAINLCVLTTDADGRSKGQRLHVNSFPACLPEGYRVYYCKGFRGSDISLSMLLSLWQMIRWAQVVHLNAVYSPPTIPTLFLCKLFGRPVVWSTRGALQRWSGTTRKGTKLVWDKLCNALCDPERVILHVTSEQERQESQTKIYRASTVVLPNGVDAPAQLEREPRSARNGLHLLYLGRLHPIKGIENLLQAVAQTDSSTQLSICGDGEANYRASLKHLAAELGLNRRVVFHGAVSNQAKGVHFRHADIVVVPSFKEAFCMVVAEALAHGVPVIASTGTPWRRIGAVGCGIWTDNDPDALTKAIEKAQGLPLEEMGMRGRGWMKREFSWAVIADQMVAQYRELVERNQPVSERGAVATRSKHNLNGRSRRYRSGF